MAEWYVRYKSGEVEGPLSVGMMKCRVAQDLLTPETLVRKGDKGEWVAGSKVKGLFREKETTTGEAQSENLALSFRSFTEDILASHEKGGISRAQDTRSPEETDQEKYPVLRVLSGLYMILAVMVGLVATGLLIYLGNSPGSLEYKAPSLVFSVVLLVFAPIGLWGIGEFILLILDIEKNTRQKK